MATTVTVTLTERMPILMHRDNIEWADKMEAWKKEAKNKGASKAGDDRTPAWRWLGCLNFDDPKTGVVTIPSEYIMACIMAGAATVPTGIRQGTFKSLSQSGLLCEDLHWPLLINGKPLAMTAISKLTEVESFSDHQKAVEKLGFSLFVKRASINGSKHIRVRPRFDNWSTSGKIIITDKQITIEVLQSILDQAGKLKGLGDWRPGAKKPGPWGTFDAKIS